MLEESKSWLKSKTVIVNVLGLIVMLVPVVLDYKLVEPELAGLILGVSNVFLRFFNGRVANSGQKIK